MNLDKDNNLGKIIKACQFKDDDERKNRLSTIQTYLKKIGTFRFLSHKEDDLRKNIELALTGKLPEEKDESPPKDDLGKKELASALGIAESDTTQAMVDS
jgi:hypothetical protein